jgi:hypothetical protein
MVRPKIVIFNVHPACVVKGTYDGMATAALLLQTDGVALIDA